MSFITNSKLDRCLAKQCIPDNTCLGEFGRRADEAKTRKKILLIHEERNWLGAPHQIVQPIKGLHNGASLLLLCRLVSLRSNKRSSEKCHWLVLLGNHFFEGDPHPFASLYLPKTSQTRLQRHVLLYHLWRMLVSRLAGNWAVLSPRPRLVLRSKRVGSMKRPLMSPLYFFQFSYLLFTRSRCVARFFCAYLEWLCPSISRSGWGSIPLLLLSVRSLPLWIQCFLGLIDTLCCQWSVQCISLFWRTIRTLFANTTMWNLWHGVKSATRCFNIFPSVFACNIKSSIKILQRVAYFRVAVE